MLVPLSIARGFNSPHLHHFAKAAQKAVFCFAVRAPAGTATRSRSGGPRVALAKWGKLYFMFYVYILESLKDKSKYIGTTNDLKNRLDEHNSGETKSNKSKIPYKIIWYCAFPNRTTAYNFERYLKSSSGYAFTSKHFLN